MGNVFASPTLSKVGKLKHIVGILDDQQRRLKRSKTDAQNRLRRTALKMTHHLANKRSRDHTYSGVDDDDMREGAEEISHQRRRVTDLKTHINVLRTLHHKVQGIIHAHFTHNALQTVNTAIKRSNISIQAVDADQGDTCTHTRSAFSSARPRPHAPQTRSRAGASYISQSTHGCRYTGPHRRTHAHRAPQ